MAVPFVVDGDASTLGAAAARRIVGRPRSRSYRPTISTPTSGRRRPRARVQYVRSREQARVLARSYGFDVLIVLAALEGALEVALRQDAAAGAAHDAVVRRAGDRRSSSCRCSPAGAFRSPRPRRCGSWPRRSRSSTGAGRRSPPASSSPGWPPRSCSATCATTSRRRLGLAVVLGGAAIVVYNDPAHAPGEFVFIPVLFAIAWLAGFAAARARRSRPRRRSTRATRGRARARGGGAHRRRRGARADRARAARHRRPLGERDGAAGRRRPAQAARRRSPRTAEALRGVERTGRARARRDAPPARRDAARRRRRSSSRRSPASTASTRCSTRSAAPACPSSCTSRASRCALPPALDLSAYRIVQEGLTNALKHARASRADVIVRYAPDELQIEVRDDGVGAAPSDGLGHGLVGIRERVKIYGGEMTRGRGERRRLRAQRAAPARRRPRDDIRVLVADDQSMVRAGFRMLLADEDGHRGRGRGEQRARGGREGRAVQPDRRPDGHPHARARRPRGDPAHPRRRRSARAS